MKCNLERDLYTEAQAGLGRADWRPSVLQLDFIPIDGGRAREAQDLL